MSAQKSAVYIEEYSEKSFVVRGDTRPHRESLKAMKGKWQNGLTDKETGEKFGAWLFWTSKHTELDGWIKGGCKPVEFSKASGDARDSGGLARLEARMASVESTLSRMEKMVKVLHDYILNGEVIEEEEEEKPKRLLGR